MYTLCVTTLDAVGVWPPAAKRAKTCTTQSKVSNHLPYSLRTGSPRRPVYTYAGPGRQYEKRFRTAEPWFKRIEEARGVAARRWLAPAGYRDCFITMTTREHDEGHNLFLNGRQFHHERRPWSVLRPLNEGAFLRLIRYLG